MSLVSATDKQKNKLKREYHYHNLEDRTEGKPTREDTSKKNQPGFCNVLQIWGRLSIHIIGTWHFNGLQTTWKVGHQKICPQVGWSLGPTVTPHKFNFTHERCSTDISYKIRAHLHTLFTDNCLIPLVVKYLVTH
jgi:hypothetical protein